MPGAPGALPQAKPAFSPTPVAVKPAIAAAPVSVAKPTDAKKKTTRIPLEAAKPTGAAKTAEAPKGPKTIRIEPLLAQPARGPASAAAEKGDAMTFSAEKRKTSRISLEAVLGGESETEAEGGPKTIRLKRPGDATHAKVDTVPKTVKVGQPSAGTAAPASPAEENAGEAPTVRKTVRVKRPSGAAGRPSISITRPEGEAAEATPTLQPMPMQDPLGDKVNALFPILALVAVLVICVTLYMFCSQFIGPNFSLTQYSYAKGGPELPWPNKLLVTR